MRRWALVGAGTLAALCAVPATVPGRIAARLLEDVVGAGGTRPGPPPAGRTAGRLPEGVAEPGGAGSGAPFGAGAARVARVVDGDTLVLRIGGRSRRVRLIGVDAPETWTRHDCFGVAASRGLRRLVPVGTEVRVMADREPYDRFGRRLFHVWTRDGRLVAAELVRRGFARALVVPPNTRYAAVLGEAEAVARGVGAGLWGACR